MNASDDTDKEIFGLRLRNLVFLSIYFGFGIFSGTYIALSGLAAIIKGSNPEYIPTAIVLVILFVVISGAVLWLKDRPWIRVNNTGIDSIYFGFTHTKIAWSEIDRIDERRTFNPLAPRKRLRFFKVSAGARSVRFTQDYDHLSVILSRINENIGKFNIEVVLQNRDPEVLAAALQAVSDPKERRKLWRTGIIRHQAQLDVDLA